MFLAEQSVPSWVMVDGAGRIWWISVDESSPWASGALIVRTVARWPKPRPTPETQGRGRTGTGLRKPLVPKESSAVHGRQRMLIRNATILSMDPAIGDLDRGDLLLDGELITAVGTDLDPGEPVTEVDATGRIAIPGLIDTHRHMWQAVLRGCAPHHTLMDYFSHILGGLGRLVTPDDVYLGNLLSAYGALNAGVTTVQDISNINSTPGHTEAIVAALRESGLRAVFAYGKDTPDGFASDKWLPDYVREVRERLLPDDDALVTMALVIEEGTDEEERRNWSLARELDVPVARHMAAYQPGDRPLRRLAELGVLQPCTTFIHGVGLSVDELRIIADYGNLSISPAIELAMGIGLPPFAAAAEAGLRPSLGVDAEVTVAADMFGQMRSAFQISRYASAPYAVRDILEFATINGARTLGMADRIGSLTPGKQADLVLLRADQPGTAPVYDPYSTVVLGMDSAHVEAVLVAGEPIKWNGELRADTAPVVGKAVDVRDWLVAAGHRLTTGSSRPRTVSWG
ncbi:amidohydrolase family protein [Streptomyces hawaiiensis]|uniref:amidohydrolase family protein n=1 Tax=Streptomyces hawaiiensis TaxID=67305 RepID=UPI003658EF4C